MFFFLNLDLTYRWYQNADFDIICADVVYLPGEKLSLSSHFCTMKLPKVSCRFDTCSFVPVSRDLRAFAS